MNFLNSSITNTELATNITINQSDWFNGVVERRLLMAIFVNGIVMYPNYTIPSSNTEENRNAK